MARSRSGRPGRGRGLSRARRERAPAEVDTEAVLRSTIDALSAHIAVLDNSGTIVAVNEAWRRFAKDAGFKDPAHGVGMNYVAVCENAAEFSPEAARTASALRDMLDRGRRDFRLEYPCSGPDGTLWFQLRITRPAGADRRRIVLAHEDITETKRAEEALAQLSARLFQLQDEERRRIARELHDTTAQNLLGVTLNVARLRQLLQQHPNETVRRILHDTLNLAEQSVQEIRTLSYLLHPPLLDEIGLASAIRWYAEGFAERSGIQVTVAAESGGRAPPDAETALFRVLQEALANIHRHSGSRSAEVILRYSSGSVALEVRDRGKGFAVGRLDCDEGVQTVGVGIAGMRLRLRQLGGRLDISSDRGGTAICATVPLPATETPPPRQRPPRTARSRTRSLGRRGARARRQEA